MSFLKRGLRWISSNWASSSPTQKLIAQQMRDYFPHITTTGAPQKENTRSWSKTGANNSLKFCDMRCWHWGRQVEIKLGVTLIWMGDFLHHVATVLKSPSVSFTISLRQTAFMSFLQLSTPCHTFPLNFCADYQRAVVSFS